MSDLKDQMEMCAIVNGQVQGVGFRAMVVWLARQLHLTGTVRNLMDGTVEICAQGSQENLDKLLTDLRSNRGRGFVQNVTVSYSNPQQVHTSFNITQ